MELAEKLSSGTLLISTLIVPKSNPKKGITIVMETKENNTANTLKIIFRNAYL